jgi:hypothetical protein
LGSKTRSITPAMTPPAAILPNVVRTGIRPAEANGVRTEASIAAFSSRAST